MAMMRSAKGIELHIPREAGHTRKASRIFALLSGTGTTVAFLVSGLIVPLWHESFGMPDSEVTALLFLLPFISMLVVFLHKTGVFKIRDFWARRSK